MSYCRFSCDDFQSDVYCYESVHGGFQIEVAGNRFVFKSPLPDAVDFSSENASAWLERHNRVMRIVHDADRVAIELPSAGKGFNEETAKEAADRLIQLREEGFRVPQYAIDNLLRESK